MRKLALLIAIEAYEGNTPPAHYAERDAEAFSEVLQRHFGFDDKTEIILAACAKKGDEHGRLTSLEPHLEKIKNAKKLDLLVFGFWGHGAEDDNDVPYLLASDSREDDLEGTAINVNYLTEQLAKNDVQSSFVVLDCCREKKRSTGGLRSVQIGSVVQSMALTLSRPKTVESKTANAIVVSACKSGEVAYPFDKKKHGFFTAALVSAFDNGARNVGAAVSEAIQLTEDVAQKYGYNQQPYHKAEGGVIKVPYPRSKFIVHWRAVLFTVMVSVLLAYIIMDRFLVKPASEPVPAQEQPTSGLTIGSSDKGVRVYVNGEFEGIAPLTLSRLHSAKSVEIRLEKEGYESLVDKVTLTKNSIYHYVAPPLVRIVEEETIASEQPKKRDEASETPPIKEVLAEDGTVTPSFEYIESVNKWLVKDPLINAQMNKKVQRFSEPNWFPQEYNKVQYMVERDGNRILFSSAYVDKRLGEYAFLIDKLNRVVALYDVPNTDVWVLGGGVQMNIIGDLKATMQSDPLLKLFASEIKHNFGLPTTESKKLKFVLCAKNIKQKIEENRHRLGHPDSYRELLMQAEISKDRDGWSFLKSNRYFDDELGRFTLIINSSISLVFMVFDVPESDEVLLITGSAYLAESLDVMIKRGGVPGLGIFEEELKEFLNDKEDLLSPLELPLEGVDSIG
ncbi:MAG: caspase family protein [Verrucomicrobiota bacterium]